MECERPSLTSHQQQRRQQLSVFTREHEMSTSHSITSPADCKEQELIASPMDMTDREEVAGTSLANTSSSSMLTAVRTASKRNNKKKKRSRLSHEWIMAMMLLLLCSSSFHQSAVLVGATSNTADEMDSRGADNNRGAKMMTRKNLNNHNNNNINGGIQRKRVGERRAAELGGGKMEQQPQATSSLSALQFQRITNHRRLDRQHQQGQQQFVNHEQKRQASSAAAVQATTTSSRTLQEGDNPFDMPTMCTCSPQIFNIKITLTSTSPCSTDDLLPNGGIDNTLCLYTNPVEEGVYPPAPPTAPPTSMEPTSSPVGTSTTTMKPTDEVTNDPFKPPPPPLTDQPKPGYPTYSPSAGDETYSPTITGMPNTPSPSYSPTNGDERMVPPPDGGSSSTSVGGSPQRDASGGSGGSGSGEPTYAPTFPWPTFSPTSNPTPYSDENGGDGAKQPRGGWMDDEQDDGMLDDDELIGLHHHRHHHHHQGPPAGGRKRVLQVINVDELNGRGEVKDGTSIDDSGSSSDGKNNSKNKDVQPPYFQPPVVRKSILDAWTSIHPNDVFFNEHPELKSYQEEIYRMKHGLPSLSSSSSSLPLSHNTRSLQDNSSTGLMPTRLISAQFLEMDTSPFMNIINQDDQYINVTFPDPTNIVLQFSSISNLLDPALPLADQMEYVPGGAILIFVGATASGEIVRNRMLWTYTMGCGLEDYTVLDGNVIGWAGFEKLTPAREEFCPSSGNLPPPPTPAPSAVPTPAPFTKAPTASAEPTTEAPSLETTSKPTKKPSSKKPTSKKPSMSMGSGDIFDHFDLSGKSKKDKKKKKKRRGMDERDFDRMKEDFRTLRRRETMMEFGRPLQ